MRRENERLDIRNITSTGTGFSIGYEGDGMMFRGLGIFSAICGFLVPYVSAESVTDPWIVMFQIAFYAMAIYYIFIMEEV